MFFPRLTLLLLAYQGLQTWGAPVHLAWNCEQCVISGNIWVWAHRGETLRPDDCLDSKRFKLHAGSLHVLQSCCNFDECSLWMDYVQEPYLLTNATACYTSKSETMEARRDATTKHTRTTMDSLQGRDDGWQIAGRDEDSSPSTPVSEARPLVETGFGIDGWVLLASLLVLGGLVYWTKKWGSALTEYLDQN